MYTEHAWHLAGERLLLFFLSTRFVTVHDTATIVCENLLYLHTRRTFVTELLLENCRRVTCLEKQTRTSTPVSNPSLHRTLIRFSLRAPRCAFLPSPPSPPPHTLSAGDPRDEPSSRLASAPRAKSLRCAGSAALAESRAPGSTSLAERVSQPPSLDARADAEMDPGPRKNR